MPLPFGVGTHIGEARIVREIGAGRVATVYEVIWRGERCALKIVDGTIESTTLPERMAQEGEAFSMIEHLNVVRWLDSGIHYGRVWLLLELVDGKNLRHVARDAGGRLPLERAVAIARHASEGLAAIHKKGIIHRDVTPENILVTRGSDIAKIADLGSAKMPKWGVKTTTAYPLTSMQYLPPERWTGSAGREPSPKDDVYAMGVIIYEVITGSNPIAPERMGVLALCSRVLHHEVPPLVSVAEVPHKLSELVARAMSKDPEKRCTMRELADGLEAVQEDLLVWRRTAARSLPLPNRERGLQLTAPMPACSDPSAAISGERSVRGAGGTIQMSAVPNYPSGGSGGGETQRSGVPSGDTWRTGPPTFETPSSQGGVGSDALGLDRSAALPPAVHVPPTLRVLSRPGREIQEVETSPPPIKASNTDDARRSTGIPVESSARPSTTSPRRHATHLALGGGLLVVLATAAWWTLFEGGTGRAEPRPALPPPPPVTSASAPKPATSASAPKPATSAPAARPSSPPSGLPRR